MWDKAVSLSPKALLSSSCLPDNQTFTLEKKLSFTLEQFVRIKETKPGNVTTKGRTTLKNQQQKENFFRHLYEHINRVC